MIKYAVLLLTVGFLTLGTTGVYKAFQQSNPSGFAALGFMLLIAGLLVGMADSIKDIY